jgi:hypothetical protein
MARNYIPKKSYFAETRIQKIAKDLIGDCKNDRERALDNFGYFRALVESNPEDDKAKTEMTKSLELSQDANTKIVKVLELMLKMTQAELKENKAPEEFSFEDLKS